MSEGFSDPIIGGASVLIRQAMESVNFIPGVSGWRVQRNGNAQFNQLTITGGSIVQGTNLFYSPIPGAGNLIMSISAVAGTDIYGNNFVSGVTVYDSGGDYIEETFGANVGWTLHLVGLTSNGDINVSSANAGTTQQGMINISPPTSAINGPPLVTLVSESSDGTKTGYIYLANSDEIRFSSQSTTVVKFTYYNGSASFVEAQLTPNGFTMIGSCNAMQPGSAVVNPESWHSLTPLLSALWTTTGASNPARYRAEPQGTGLCVRLDGEILTVGVGPWPANATIATLPIGYRNLLSHPFITRSDIAVAAGADTVNVIGPSGSIQNGQTYVAAGQRLFLDGIVFPLD